MGFLSFKPSPEICLLCHDSTTGKGLCDACLKDLSVLATDASKVCPRCGCYANGTLCGQCQKKPPPFERLWASAEYAPPLSGILHQFKHKRDSSLVQPLAELMAALPPPWLAETEIDGVLAMPLSKERRLSRGFNQCDELTALLAQRFCWNILPHTMVFRQASVPQSTLPFSRRRQNVRGLFRVTQNVNKRNLLLIDDVVTSGTTLSELARELQTAGDKRIFCWTLAQARMKIS